MNTIKIDINRNPLNQNFLKSLTKVSPTSNSDESPQTKPRRRCCFMWEVTDHIAPQWSSTGTPSNRFRCFSEI